MLQTDGTHSRENSKRQSQGGPHVLKSVLLEYEFGSQSRDLWTQTLYHGIFFFLKQILFCHPIITDTTEISMLGERLGSEKIYHNGLKTLGFWREST